MVPSQIRFFSFVLFFVLAGVLSHHSPGGVQGPRFYAVCLPQGAHAGRGPAAILSFLRRTLKKTLLPLPQNAGGEW